MRQWIDICESHNLWIRVYRGCDHGHGIDGAKFFSTSKRFAEQYGDVRAYEINVEHYFDTTDRDTMEDYLPIEDPYTETMIEDWSDYEDRISDTWEFVENHFDIGRGGRPPAPVMLITEGGIENYVVFDSARIRPLESE